MKSSRKQIRQEKNKGIEMGIPNNKPANAKTPKQQRRDK